MVEDRLAATELMLLQVGDIHRNPTTACPSMREVCMHGGDAGSADAAAAPLLQKPIVSGRYSATAYHHFLLPLDEEFRHMFAKCGAFSSCHPAMTRMHHLSNTMRPSTALGIPMGTLQTALQACMKYATCPGPLF